jgi:hypothetical protein
MSPRPKRSCQQASSFRRRTCLSCVESQEPMLSRVACMLRAEPTLQASRSVSLLFEFHTVVEQRVDQGTHRIDVRPFGVCQLPPYSGERVPLDAR